MRLTVADLARRALPQASDQELAAAVRQLRHWTQLGLLSLVAGESVFTGTGRHREYDENSVYMAALLFEFSKWKLPPRLVESAVRTLNMTIALKADGRAWDLWRQAVNGKAKVVVWISMYKPAERPGIVTALEAQEAVAQRMADVAARSEFSSTLVVHLTELFARLDR